MNMKIPEKKTTQNECGSISLEGLPFDLLIERYTENSLELVVDIDGSLKIRTDLTPEQRAELKKDLTALHMRLILEKREANLLAVTTTFTLGDETIQIASPQVVVLTRWGKEATLDDTASESLQAFIKRAQDLGVDLSEKLGKPQGAKD